MPGWPEANESLTIPTPLSNHLESWTHVPLPAVPDWPSTLSWDDELRISMP